MKVSEAFGGFLEAEDLPEGKDIPVTILGVRQSTKDDKGSDGKPIDKPLVQIQNVKKEWVLNKTCARVIRRLYGNDMSEWAGKKVTLHRDVCNAFGKRNVPCIRVRGKQH